MRGGSSPLLGTLSIDKCGRLAQLVRAPRLHRGCRGFESLSVHIAKLAKLVTAHV